MSISTSPVSTEIASSNGHASRTRLTIGKANVASLDKGVALGDMNDKQWQRWQRHLQRRKRPPSLAELTKKAGIEALLWGLHESATAHSGEFLEHVDTALRKRKSRSARHPEEFLAPWLAEAAGGAVDIPFAVDALACAHALPALASTAPRALWCDALSLLLQIAAEAHVSPIADPLAHQLLAGELPLTLACMLPEISQCRTLAKSARGTLTDGLLTLLDGEGLPHGQFLHPARGLLACWTRSSLLGRGLKKGCFDEAANEQFAWLVRQSIRLARPDGSQMLADASAGGDNNSLLAAALEVGGDATDRRLAQLALPAKSTTPKNGHRLPEAALHSEWAQLALLRASWASTAPRLLVNYAGDGIATELCVDRHVIWSGDCSPTIAVDGQDLSATDGWGEICWFSDEDVDYLELEIPLEQDWKIQRQFLLAREDQFLLVADAVYGPQGESIQYGCDWPVADAVRVLAADETTECALVARRRKISVLPLALPEWRSDGRRAGELAETAGGALRYALRRSGRRLYAPLLLDVSPSRAKKEFTWRILSVGENLQACRPETAVGYRVQLGIQQWLIYRSLAPVASRTVLGQNTFHEFICGRFDCEGEVDSLIEVE